MSLLTIVDFAFRDENTQFFSIEAELLHDGAMYMVFFSSYETSDEDGPSMEYRMEVLDEAGKDVYPAWTEAPSTHIAKTLAKIHVQQIILDAINVVFEARNKATEQAIARVKGESYKVKEDL